MKKWLAYGALFFCVYLVFVIATIPANFALSLAKLPRNIELTNVEGSIWQANIAQLQYQGISIEQVSVQTSFWSLLVLSPSLTIKFGGALLDGPEGKFTVSGLLNELSIEQLQLSIAANDIAQQLALPIPLTAKGYVDLSIEDLTFAPVGTKDFCQQLSGKITWPKAQVNALDEKVKLGELSAKLNCDKGAIAIVVNPKNDLGLSFTAYVRQGGRFSGNGYLKPGNKFPRQLNDVLPFIGSTDKQGRYRLKL